MKPEGASLPANRASALDWALWLCSRRSVTPGDGGILGDLAPALEELGWVCERMDCSGVKNLWAAHPEALAQNRSRLAFMGHVDVVPEGDLAAWSSDPWVPRVEGGMLCARGAADMKGGIAAFLAALHARSAQGFAPAAAMLLTSDEEGEARWGSRYALEELARRGFRADSVLVGEPASACELGDAFKQERRGSISAKFEILGVQGHAAYPENCANPIALAQPLMAWLAQADLGAWEGGGAKAGLQMVKAFSQPGPSNMVPGRFEIEANLRFGAGFDLEGFKAEAGRRAAQAYPGSTARWGEPSMPYNSEPGPLSRELRRAGLAVLGREPAPSSAGGTSDGRFAGLVAGEIAEYGLPCGTAHKADERVKIEDLGLLAEVYARVLEGLGV